MTIMTEREQRTGETLLPLNVSAFFDPSLHSSQGVSAEVVDWDLARFFH